MRMISWLMGLFFLDFKGPCYDDSSPFLHHTFIEELYKSWKLKTFKNLRGWALGSSYVSYPMTLRASTACEIWKCQMWLWNAPPFSFTLILCLHKPPFPMGQHMAMVLMSSNLLWGNSVYICASLFSSEQLDWAMFPCPENDSGTACVEWVSQFQSSSKV